MVKKYFVAECIAMDGVRAIVIASAIGDPTTRRVESDRDMPPVLKWFPYAGGSQCILATTTDAIAPSPYPPCEKPATFGFRFMRR